MYKHMGKVVIKILQGSAVTQTVLGGLTISSGYKFPIVYICQKLCKLAGSRQSYRKTTRKLCYRKDDRAMRPIYGCPEKFRESSQTPPATFPEICKGLLFRSILRMCIQNLKFVALSVPEIIEVLKKIWAVPRYARAPFSLKFLKGFCSDGPSEYTCQI